jgi:hypothetical protein
MVCFLLFLPGCSRETADHASVPAVQVVKMDEEWQRRGFGDHVRSLLMNGRFADLEHLADSLRTTHARFSNGSLGIRGFYWYGFGNALHDWDEVLYLRFLKQTRAWRQAYPASITAPVAEAELLIGYAWLARGSGYANTVTERGWERFRERLGRAHTLLDQAATLPQRCPGWFLAAQKLAVGEEWSNAESERLFREAKAADPTCEVFYDLRAWALAPKWQGLPGDWEKFLEDAVSDLDPPEARRIYAYVVQKKSLNYGNVFRDTRADWERTRLGYDEMLGRWPESLELRSQAALLALDAGDLDYARSMFEVIGLRDDPFIWEDQREFLAGRARANTAVARR